METRTSFRLLIVAAAASALLSCGSIYATIETEQKAANNNLPTYLTVENILITIPGSKYYVAAGGVFQGVLNGTTNTMSWTPNITTINATASGTNAYTLNPTYGAVTSIAPADLCNTLAYFKGNLYGGFTTSSGNVGLIESDANLSFANQTPVSSVAGKQVTMLSAQGPVPTSTYLFMGTATAGTTAFTYDLEYSTDGITWTVSPNLSGLSYPVLAVVWDGTNYYAVTKNTVYKATTPAGLAVLATAPALTTGPVNQPANAINNIFADSSNGAIFISTVRDGIYVSTNAGASWTAVTTPIVTGTIPVSFLTVAGSLNAPTSSVYLAGSDGYGYYVLAGSGTSWTLTRQTYSTILLYGESVSEIAVDGTDGDVLIGTNGNGVWRALFGTDGNLQSGASWIHESGGSTTSSS